MKRLLPSFLLLAVSIPAQTPPGSTLEYVAVLARHGVRSALKTNDFLADYSSQPWKAIPAPLEYLTAHGYEQERLIGLWDLGYLKQAALMSSQRCDESNRFYFRADSSQRDIESARAMAYAMFPDCVPVVHSLPIGKADPMFPTANTPGVLDREAVGAELDARAGGDTAYLLRAHRTELEEIQKVLTGSGPAPKKSVLDPDTVTGDRYARASGRIGAIQSVLDALILEYEEGFPDRETWWGRMTPANAAAVLAVNEAMVDLLWDTPDLARARGSNLLDHILRSMQQAVEGRAVDGALGNPDSKGLFILGHDSDFGFFSTLLGLTWNLESLPPRGTPPGAQMLFEIWRNPGGVRTVRLSMVAQTIPQIRAGVAPGPNAPPMKVAVSIPGCSAKTEGFPCEWSAFQQLVKGALDPKLYRPDPDSVR